MLRTLLSEYSRLVDHLTCIAAGLMELGAMTAFLYLVMIRDYMYEHLAALTGARVTYTYGRIGGLARDLPDGWLARLEEILVQYEEFVGRVHGLVDRNRIFIDRMRNVGVISTADALSYGYTGVDPALAPACRATCARTRPTSPTRSSTSTCRWASRATTTTATTCACARWTSRCT